MSEIVCTSFWINWNGFRIRFHKKSNVCTFIWGGWRGEEISNQKLKRRRYQIKSWRGPWWILGRQTFVTVDLVLSTSPNKFDFSPSAGDVLVVALSSLNLMLFGVTILLANCLLMTKAFDDEADGLFSKEKAPHCNVRQNRTSNASIFCILQNEWKEFLFKLKNK